MNGLWLLIRKAPLIGIGLAIELGFEACIEFVWPALALRRAEWALRHVPKLLELKKHE